MSTMDRARLELAKRAYQSTQPNAMEVQAGVRRARLWLGRSKPRRRWFSKGLVFVVLALSGLAYAKPGALGELVQDVQGWGSGRAHDRGGKLPVAVAEPAKAATALKPASATAGSQARSVEAIAPPQAPSFEHAAVPTRASAEPAVAKLARRARAPKRAAAPPEPPTTTASQSAQATVSDWGRVGQALAHGDETAALSALEQLSRSDDQRTRDKADLGSAQLFMAHGDTVQGCSLAFALTHRRAGTRIERQARVLLQSCASSK